MPSTKPIRILLAKTGLDGHDRGAKVLAALLQREGFEVVYLGLYNTVEMVVQGAIEEDVDVIGLSFLSGEHLSITRKLMAELKRREVDDIPVIIGGILPPEDVGTLLEMGVEKVFRGAMARDVVEFLSSNFSH
ncbi:MAG: cobalamin-dependent protein [Deltaproteobacteria bacterium]